MLKVHKHECATKDEVGVDEGFELLVTQTTSGAQLW